MQPTIRGEDGRLTFDWGGGLTIEAENTQRTRSGIRTTLKVSDLADEESPVVGMDNLLIDDQRARDQFCSALQRRDGRVNDWGAKLLLVAENLSKRAVDSERRRPTEVDLHTVEREEVEWLWASRIPLGKLTVLEGDPGCGKSWLSLAIATAVTTGRRLPGQTETGEPSRVLLLTAEDGLADTVRPRAEDLGADLSRITVLKGVQDGDGREHQLDLTEHLSVLDEILARGGFRYVVIDPINAYLGVSLDTHRDAAIRSVLTPLAELAEKYGVAIVCILHLTKSGRDKAIYRGQGSIGYSAAARTVLLVGQNPDDEQERVVVCIKNNLVAFPPALAFEISEGQFRWRGETSVTASALLAPEQGSEARSLLDEATEFLDEVLGQGSQPAREIERQADAMGISKMTLKRARKAMGVRAVPVREEGRPGVQRWLWELPESLGGQEAHTKESDPLTPDSYLEGSGQGEGVDPLTSNPLQAELLEGQPKAEDKPARVYCGSLAEVLGYPRLEYQQGHTVAAGAEAWGKFLERGEHEDVAAATEVLEQLGERDRDGA